MVLSCSDNNSTLIYSQQQNSETINSNSSSSLGDPKYQLYDTNSNSSLPLGDQISDSNESGSNSSSADPPNQTIESQNSNSRSSIGNSKCQPCDIINLEVESSSA